MDVPWHVPIDEILGVLDTGATPDQVTDLRDILVKIRMNALSESADYLGSYDILYESKEVGEMVREEISMDLME